MTTQPDSLDKVQLAKIEGVHRGFLYQHLYASACLLLARKLKFEKIVVEHDEDLYLIGSSRWFYLQIKTRETVSLSPSAIGDMLSRFEVIRAAHLRGERPGIPHFALVANKPPSENLATLIKSWPDDVEYISPGTTSRYSEIITPHTTLGEMLALCRLLATDVPYTKLSPETMVWKLASFVMFMSSGQGGGGSHNIETSSLPDILEQFFAQLHRIPEAPVILREMGTTFEAEFQGLQILEGPPGCGKTTWAGQIIRHTPRATTYVDASQAPLGGLTGTIAREVLATCAPKNGELSSQVLATGYSGLEALGLVFGGVNNVLTGRLLVIIDNAHVDGTARALTDAIRLGQNVDWLVLGHPGEEMQWLANATESGVVRLLGWAKDSIAAEVSLAKCQFQPEDIDSLFGLTEGNPLFVRGIVNLAYSHYSGDLRSAIEDVSGGIHPVRTSQERILGKIVNAQSSDARCIVAILGLSDLPLPFAIVEELAATMKLNQHRVRQELRSLSEWSVVEVADGCVRLRDSYRPSAVEVRAPLGNEIITSLARQLADWAYGRIRAQQGQIENLLLYIRLLPIAGDIKRLVQVATSDDEVFIEYGLMPEVRRILALAIVSDKSEPLDKFFSLDTLAFWAMCAEDTISASAFIEEMRRFSGEPWFLDQERMNLAHKEMLLAGKTGNWMEAEQCANRVLNDPTITDQRWKNITIYNLAVCAYECKRLDDATRLSRIAVDSCFQATGLTRRDLSYFNPDDIRRRLKILKFDDSTAIKHLADALDLCGRIARDRGNPAALLDLMQAHKLYIVADAFLSAAKVGKDVVDAMLEVGDARSARELVDSLLSMANRFRFAEEIIHLRAQRAVVLAYCGDIDSARMEIGKIRNAYFGSLSDFRLSELENQASLIERIASGRVRLPSLLPVSSSMIDEARRGREPSLPRNRNSMCPCGSNIRYKRCCGRQPS
ncbi:SEC-C domain-containing protein [Nannocystaceae bacterium ST9]